MAVKNLDANSLLELPVGKRTFAYRCFEILPAALSVLAFLLLFILPFISVTATIFYILAMFFIVVSRSLFTAIMAIAGFHKMKRVIGIDWQRRLLDLESPLEAYEKRLVHFNSGKRLEYWEERHIENIRMYIRGQNKKLNKFSIPFPKPSDVYNVVMIAVYNEPIDIVRSTVESVLRNEYDAKGQMVLVLAYEERGGGAVEADMLRLQAEFSDRFLRVVAIKHPDGLPDEVVGKGANLTYAGEKLGPVLKELKIKEENAIITTLDSDNRPEKSYFAYLTYEFIMNRDRNNVAFQPISLFTGNIWDAPAPVRIVATMNSFWYIVCSNRPNMLRNVASHSQGFKPLRDMGFWSKRSINEDSHQYWRSLFALGGNYSVVPIYSPIHQDVILEDTVVKTLKAQFVQLRRWNYGIADIAYVGVRLVNRKLRNGVNFGFLLFQFLQLAYQALFMVVPAVIVFLGGGVLQWLNLTFIESRSIGFHALPTLLAQVQTVGLIAMFGIIIMSIRMMPPKPKRYKVHKTVLVVLQWALMPFVVLIYNSAVSFYSQMRLATARYMTKFDVTTKYRKSKREEKLIR